MIIEGGVLDADLLIRFSRTLRPKFTPERR
jgi:hypothetical protein